MDLDYPMSVRKPDPGPTVDSKMPRIYRSLDQTGPVESEYLGPEPPHVTVLGREEWGAAAAKDTPTHNIPLTHLRFTDTDTAQCFSREECTKLLQDLQKKHMEEEGLADIKWNFMIDSNGLIYVGRGWLHEADRPKEEWNVNYDNIKGRSCDIAYIGTFDNTFTEEVPWPMMQSAFHFTYWGEKQGFMDTAFSITQLRPPANLDPLSS